MGTAQFLVSPGGTLGWVIKGVCDLLPIPLVKIRERQGLGRGPFPNLFLRCLLSFIVEPTIAGNVEGSRRESEAGPGLFNDIHGTEQDILLNRKKLVIVRGSDIHSKRNVQGEIAVADEAHPHRVICGVNGHGVRMQQFAKPCQQEPHEDEGHQGHAEAAD